jgi:DNA-binding GntR family transcriptional regulator
MRQLLECHGIKESFTRGDIEWEGRVLAAHHKLAAMEKKMADGDVAGHETWRMYDWSFHLALISSCASRVVLDTYTGICDKYLHYQMLTAKFRGQIAADEHRILLECALARDWRAAQETLVAHIQECVTQMAATIDAGTAAN